MKIFFSRGDAGAKSGIDEALEGQPAGRVELGDTMKYERIIKALQAWEDLHDGSESFDSMTRKSTMPNQNEENIRSAILACDPSGQVDLKNIWRLAKLPEAKFPAFLNTMRRIFPNLFKEGFYGADLSSDAETDDGSDNGNLTARSKKVGVL